MQDLELRNLLLSLIQAQQANNFMIKAALFSYAPDDKFMLGLYKSQDEIYTEIRNIIEVWPNINKTYLDEFDQLLYELRLNLFLVLQDITLPTK